MALAKTFSETLRYPDPAAGAATRGGNAAAGADNCFLGGDLNSDATTLSNGTQATDGFAALADLDSNHDDVVNASDAAFSQLRVWRDADQDGITDAGELQTLGSLGIAGLNVASTSHAQTLANGNELADLGTFIKADGQVGIAINDFIWKIPA